MKPFNYFQPTEIRFGRGRLRQLGKAAARFGQRALLVTVPSAEPLGPVIAKAKGSAVAPNEKVTAAGDTARITKDTLIGSAEGQLLVDTAGAAKDDLKFTLRDSTTFTVSLVGATKVQDILDKINNAAGNGGKLVASLDEAKQQFVFTDKTTPTEATSAATSVTQTGSPVFYGREGGTAVAAPKSGAATSEDLNFALRVGTLSERFFVTVVGDTYTGTDAEMKAAWLADIKNAIKEAMQDAGQLKLGEAAVVDVKFIAGKLIFDSAKTLTIWTDTTKGSAVIFKIEAQNASKALGQLGLGTLTANTDGTVVTHTLT